MKQTVQEVRLHANLTEHVVRWADLAAHAYYMNPVTILTM